LQHTQDHTEAFKHLLTNIEVVKLEDKTQILPAYVRALTRTDSKSTLIIEDGEHYNS